MLLLKDCCYYIAWNGIYIWRGTAANRRRTKRNEWDNPERSSWFQSTAGGYLNAPLHADWPMESNRERIIGRLNNSDKRERQPSSSRLPTIYYDTASIQQQERVEKRENFHPRFLFYFLYFSIPLKNNLIESDQKRLESTPPFCVYKSRGKRTKNLGLTALIAPIEAQLSRPKKDIRAQTPHSLSP